MSPKGTLPSQCIEAPSNTQSRTLSPPVAVRLPLCYFACLSRHKAVSAEIAFEFEQQASASMPNQVSMPTQRSIHQPFPVSFDPLASQHGTGAHDTQAHDCEAQKISIRHPHDTHHPVDIHHPIDDELAGHIDGLQAGRGDGRQTGNCVGMHSTLASFGGHTNDAIHTALPRQRGHHTLVSRPPHQSPSSHKGREGERDTIAQGRQRDCEEGGGCGAG